MRPEFNERSYEFAFTENFMRMKSRGRPFVPYFLSQRREHKKGFDMQMKFRNGNWSPYFFQFKMPELMKTASSKEIRRYNANVRPPYYRMNLYPKDSYRQQNILANLEKTNRNRVFYAVPEFHKYADLNKYYNKKVIVKNSALFSPLDISRAKSLSRNERHTIAYNAKPRFGYLCSEPKELDKYDLKKLLLEDQHDGRKEEQSPEEKISKLIETSLFSLKLNEKYFMSEVCKYAKGREHNESKEYTDKVLALGTLVQRYANSCMFIQFW